LSQGAEKRGDFRCKYNSKHIVKLEFYIFVGRSEGFSWKFGLNIIGFEVLSAVWLGRVMSSGI
jgi:hypothetical protein